MAGVQVKNTEALDIDNAVKIAAQSDVAVVVAGIEEGEFRDRLTFPSRTSGRFHNRIAATGKPVAVVLVGGSAITMNNWMGNVSSILDVWYPGEEGATPLPTFSLATTTPQVVFLSPSPYSRGTTAGLQP